jgi:uncharacterized membrane protein
MTTTIERSLELEVPARVAYDQWTQFEDFPQFLPDVDSVKQIDERHLDWRVHIGGHPTEFRTEICEQIPDKRIAWRSTSGPWHAGAVTFHRLSDTRSRIMLQLDYEPEGFTEKVGDKLGLAKHRIQKDLDAFKQFLESRGEATGAWRGRIPSPDEA